MIVMTLHEFYDDDVIRVRMDGDQYLREIVLKESNQGSLLISKEDVIALAKDFGLVVYLKDANL